LDESKLSRSVFESTSIRFQTTDNRSPGPTQYDPHQESVSLSNPKFTGFAAQLSRDSLLFKDVEQCPFVDTSIVNNPSPDRYHQISKSVGRLLGENKGHSFLQSQKPTLQVLQNVSLEKPERPGPGTYEI
jgi:hypothetical protein